MKALLCLLACSVVAFAGVQGYTLVDNYSGSTFFNGFTFFTGGDPTHGYVYYASKDQATSWGYISVQNGVVFIRSDSSSVASGSGRGSVRISSTKSYTQGLFLFDIAHMPYGCGSWPAVWTCGPNWPNEGEIDVIEGVNVNKLNSMTLHSKAGCSMNGVSRQQTGTTNANDCNSFDNGNAGCGVSDTRTTSYGQGFNNNGGGVHALLWTSSFIKVYFFPRNAIPSDITSGNPNPDSWGTPVAHFPFGSNCPSGNFADHQIIVDNTFCGDWAGSVYPNSGCPGSCNSFVQNNPHNFTESYWAINSFKVYK